MMRPFQQNDNNALSWHERLENGPKTATVIQF